MGDTTDTNAGDIKASEGVVPAKGGGNTAAGRSWLGRSWFGRHWRGELPLVEAFWINGILVSLVPEVLSGIAMGLSSDELGVGFALVLSVGAALWRFPMWMIWPMAMLSEAGSLVVLPKAGSLVVLTKVIFLAAYMAIPSAVAIWQIVGIWRSAGHYPGQRLPDGRYVSRRLWLIAARVLMVAWGFQLLHVYWIFLT